MCLQWGNKWALQTVHSNDTTEDEFDANIDSVVWPEGWAVEKVCRRIGSGSGSLQACLLGAAAAAPQPCTTWTICQASPICNAAAHFTIPVAAARPALPLHPRLTQILL